MDVDRLVHELMLVEDDDIEDGDVMATYAVCEYDDMYGQLWKALRTAEPIAGFSADGPAHDVMMV